MKKEGKRALWPTRIWRVQSSYCILSSSLHHPLHHLQENNPSTKVLHMVSDGSTTQYLSKKNFFLVTEPFNMGFQTSNMEFPWSRTWHDGVGVAVKRMANALVAKEEDIQNGTKLCEELSKVKSSVTLFNVTDDKISKVEWPLINDLHTVKGTMKIHQVCNNAAPLYLINILNKYYFRYVKYIFYRWMWTNTFSRHYNY